MLYITLDELQNLTALDPSLTVPDTVAQQYELIKKACRKADGAVRRPIWGMEIRTIYNDQIPLDLNYTGMLNHSPWIRWNNSDTFVSGNQNIPLIAGNGLVIVPGTFSVQQVVLNDFDVYKPASVIRYHRLRLGGNFPRTTDPYQGWWGETLAAYHAGAETQIDANEMPYELTCSYTAGYFTTLSISTAMPSGATQVVVSDVTNLTKNSEFYFSSDPINEPETDTRIITAIDTNTNTVTFSPATTYAIDTTATFRKVDKNARDAVLLIVADMLTYPSNTKMFRKGLGRNAIFKQWERRNLESIPGEAMELLSIYLW